MQRREFITILGGVAGVPLAARAQQKSMPVIGVLGIDSGAASVAAFRRGLRELGYIEGGNISIEYRWAEGKPERFSVLATELVALKVDVIVATGGTLGAHGAKRATTTVPIVFSAVADPVAEGLVASLARPGGNLTGLSAVSPDLVGKLLELLKQAVPEVSVIALLFKPDSMSDPVKEVTLKEAHISARALGVQLQIMTAQGPADFDRAFSDISAKGAGALVVLSNPVFDIQRQRIVDLAANGRLPTAHSFRNYVDIGGLMSYGPSFVDLHRRTATYVDKILKGAKPADLPVEQPTKFELVLNLRTAKRLGLEIPAELVARADEVIE
ncbi:MAG: ABC transporter substrate-binding protein [Alphaproteobacteria bacterium]|jgi:putative ABC transport system substrate-binding protein|nr:MAG: ABC transporter substrate-binding protein [Alphaproteobacteria bacterium]